MLWLKRMTGPSHILVLVAATQHNDAANEDYRTVDAVDVLIVGRSKTRACISHWVFVVDFEPHCHAYHHHHQSFFGYNKPPDRGTSDPMAPSPFTSRNHSISVCPNMSLLAAHVFLEIDRNVRINQGAY